MQQIDIETILYQSLVGATLQQRYTIQKKIGIGSYGQIHRITDEQDPERHLVIKFCEDTEMLAREISVAKQIQRSEVVAYGLILHQETVKAYMIMPRYGISLDQYFDTCGQYFSDQTVCAIGTSLLESLSRLHNKGYVYNDMKPDNILVDLCAKIPRRITSQNALKDTSLHLIDFGFAKKYLNKDNGHFEQDEENYFHGNLLFASRDHLQFLRTSRKDDLESLMYLLIYFLNDGNILGMTTSLDMKDQKSVYELSIKSKKQATLDDLCSGRASKLRPFCQEVLKIGYKETPDYQNLIFALEELLN